MVEVQTRQSIISEHFSGSSVQYNSFVSEVLCEDEFKPLITMKIRKDIRERSANTQMFFSPLQPVPENPVSSNLAKFETGAYITRQQKQSLIALHLDAVHLSEKGCQQCSKFLQAMSENAVRKAQRKYSDVGQVLLFS